MFLINNLEVGSTYKSLKDMCNVLGKKYSKSANSRKAILKEIECSYRLEREGNKYTVIEIYKQKKGKVDGRINNGGGIRNTKYDTLMDDLLINYLYIKNLESLDITFNELFGQNEDIENNIPLLTNDYKNLLSIGYEQFANEIAIRKDLVDIYTEKLRKIISKCLETTLNRLQKQNILTWQKNIMVKKYDLELEIADENLVDEIKQKEQEVYEELNITYFQRKNSAINKRFKREVYKKLTHHYVASYWNVYSIEVMDEDKIIEIENTDEIKKELSNRFMKSIHMSLINKTYGNKVESTGGIGKIRTNVHNPFDNMESIENMNKLDRIFFVDYKEKDDMDIMIEILEGTWS